MSSPRLLVFKLGGKILEDGPRLAFFLQGFAAIPEAKILVHGGGVLADEMAARLGIETHMHEGRRITSRAMRDLLTMVYGGGINKSLVSALQNEGCDAIGLTGADAGLLRAKRRKAGAVDFAYVGDIEEVNVERLKAFLAMGLCPVIAPLSWDGEILNTNADSVAAHLAISLAPDFEVQLVYGFEQKGVLEDRQDPESCITTLDRPRYLELRSAGRVADGMLPKLEACFTAKEKGVQAVLIAQEGEGLAFARGEFYQGSLIEI